MVRGGGKLQGHQKGPEKEGGPGAKRGRNFQKGKITSCMAKAKKRAAGQNRTHIANDKNS
jgi:hypothetical protein